MAVLFFSIPGAAMPVVVESVRGRSQSSTPPSVDGVVDGTAAAAVEAANAGPVVFAPRLPLSPALRPLASLASRSFHSRTCRLRFSARAVAIAGVGTKPTPLMP